MKHLFATLLVTFTILSTTAFAQGKSPEKIPEEEFNTLPTGHYYGNVSSSSFGDPCRIDSVDFEITKASGTTLNLFWRERGFGCTNMLDAWMTPSGEGRWNVRFNYNFDLYFGYAELRGNRLIFDASYRGGMRMLRFEATFTINEDDSLFYSRRIDYWSGPSFYARGYLSK